MKKSILLLTVIMLIGYSCKVNEPACTDCPDGTSSGGSSTSGCGNGKTLYRGSEGGCYYINSNGNKTYVDRSCCD